MKKTLELVLEKLSENSTWRGLILLGTALGVKIQPELQESIIVAGLGLVGLINVVRKGLWFLIQDRSKQKKKRSL